MGICDLVPGISGGTMALITGIYEELIKTLTHLRPKNFKKGFVALASFDSKKISKFFSEINFWFIFILALGISSAIIIGSSLISYLLLNFNVYLFAFFIGLILASTKIIYDRIEDKKITEIALGFFGFFIGISFLYLTPRELLEPSVFYLFFAGFIAVSAMFLPGISGSYLLLLMGLYEYVIAILNNLFSNLFQLTIFVLGVLLGIFLIPRGIHYLFENWKSRTLAFLMGLVVGSLGVPLSNVFNQVPESSVGIIVVLILVVIGALIVLLAERFIR